MGETYLVLLAGVTFGYNCCESSQHAPFLRNGVATAELGWFVIAVISKSMKQEKTVERSSMFCLWTSVSGGNSWVVTTVCLFQAQYNYHS